MSYNLSIQVEQDYIRAEVTGTRIKGQETDDSLAIWSSVAEACTKNGIFQVLAVFSLAGSLPTLAAYEIGNLPHQKRCTFEVASGSGRFKRGIARHQSVCCNGFRKSLWTGQG